MRRLRTLPLAAQFVLIVGLAGCAGMEGLGRGGDRPLDEATVATGLREALRVGSERASRKVGVRGGYLESPTLRIPLPQDLQEVAGTLRRAGLGSQVDELEVAMNRAAEQAATEAVDVFAGAIAAMTLEDAFSILRGHDTAATEYFRARTATELTTRYRPIVEGKLRTVGGYRNYEQLVASLQSLPLVEPPDLNLVNYVTGQALDGLFTVLGQEERRIRQDPLARTTEVLQRVFGRRSAANRPSARPSPGESQEVLSWRPPKTVAGPPGPGDRWSVCPGEPRVT
ncbi:MAG: DUF4197 domain-containing protein [Candidatus Krumholzibacteriia bacterium]